MPDASWLAAEKGSPLTDAELARYTEVIQSLAAILLVGRVPAVVEGVPVSSSSQTQVTNNQASMGVG